MAGRVLVKPGADIADMAPAGVLILSALKQAARKLQIDLTVTSGRDGEHSGPADPHHAGEALDIRSHDVDPALRLQVLDAVLYALGRDRFFGFLEAAGTSNEHFHIQRRKNTTFHLQEWLAA